MLAREAAPGTPPMTEPTVEEVAAAEAVNSLQWDKVYAAARRRCLRDMTGGFYDEHLAREVAEQLADKISQALSAAFGGRNEQ